MTNEALISDLVEAKTADRQLDVYLHEILTGEICQCKDGDVAAANHAHGEILREAGGELKWWQVPLYTFDFDTTAKWLNANNHAVKITMAPPTVIEAGKVNNGQVEVWLMSAWNPFKFLCVATARHDVSAAICCALLALKVKARPEDAVNCASCDEYFKPSDALKDALRVAVKKQLTPLPVCSRCTLEMREVEGNG